jgi:hypothetical protein
MMSFIIKYSADNLNYFFYQQDVMRYFAYILCLLSDRPIFIRSNENDYQIRRNEIKNHLRKRGYSNDIVENQLYKVDNLERENLLQYTTRKQHKSSWL